MAQVTDIETIRDGGTILFRLSGTEADGSYRLQTPFLGTPRPLFKGERKLAFGSIEESSVAAVLTEWLDAAASEEVKSCLAELDSLSEWRNLPAHLVKVVPLHRIRTVVRELNQRLYRADKMA